MIGLPGAQASRMCAALLLNIMALWDGSTIIGCYVKASGNGTANSFFFQLKALN